MPVIRCQVRIPYFTNLPEDVITNTWHFFWDGVTDYEDACGYLTARLDTFYTACYSGSNGAPWVRWDLAAAHWYNLSDPPPRVPFIVPMPIAGVTIVSTSFPMEAAVCLSYQADPLSGMSQARRRGRIFLGGLNGSWFDNGAAATFPSVSVTRANAVITAVEANILVTGDAGLQWVVWSPTASASSVVSNGWIDNAIDTQRRRGNAPSSRILWP